MGELFFVHYVREEALILGYSAGLHTFERDISFFFLVPLNNSCTQEGTKTQLQRSIFLPFESRQVSGLKGQKEDRGRGRRSKGEKK